MRAPLPAGPHCMLTNPTQLAAPFCQAAQLQLDLYPLSDSDSDSDSDSASDSASDCATTLTHVRPASPAHVWAPLPPAIVSVDVSCAVDVAAEVDACSDNPLGQGCHDTVASSSLLDVEHVRCAGSLLRWFLLLFLFFALALPLPASLHVSFADIITNICRAI